MTTGAWEEAGSPEKAISAKVRQKVISSFTGQSPFFHKWLERI
ncbi:MAG: hypothetical protein RDV48_14995 [Candidatus Eremiobacteraeota bacterium]|nr:hypothetical protein [Candidatus Eremiobacteraeota bacterium]